MGQKVNPKIQRIGINSSWESKWFSDRLDYPKLLHRDIALRKAINDRLKDAGISRIEIERSPKKVIINIYTSKPGIIIGRQGAAIESLRFDLEKKFKESLEVNIREVRKPDLDAKIIAKFIAVQIEKRVPYRRAAKMAIEKAMQGGAQGVKIFVGGRLNGVEIARKEYFSDGKIPLHTFRSNIFYAKEEAHTLYGQIGVKVWIYQGELFKKQPKKDINSEHVKKEEKF